MMRGIQWYEGLWFSGINKVYLVSKTLLLNATEITIQDQMKTYEVFPSPY